jgi:hypothetical protein
MNELTMFLKSKGFDCCDDKANTEPQTTVFFEDFVMHIPVDVNIQKLYRIRNDDVYFEEDMEKWRREDL